MPPRIRSLLPPVLLLAAAPAQYATWTRLNPANAFSPRSSPAMFFETASNRLVVYGGFDANRVHLSDLWDWDGTNWTQRTSQTSPSGRADFALAYDPIRQRAVLFGGQTNRHLRNVLEAWPEHIVVGAGGSQVLDVDFGFDGSNKDYWVLGTMTGTTPGTKLFNAVLPLNLDPYTDLAFTARNSALFQRFAGRLGADGRATATLALPPIAGFVGPLTLHHAAIRMEITWVSVSNPAVLELR